MSIAALLRWQWNGYARYHRSRTNLLWHFVLVPLFIAGNLALITALVHGFVVLTLMGTTAMTVSIALQGLTHRKESMPPEPFTGIGNALARIFLEQWVTFPRFVLSGGWIRALTSRQ
jgi:hypothetical protein